MQKILNVINPKPELSKRCKRYLGIMTRGVITKSETTVLDTFESVTQGKVRITPEHTKQGLNFFKSLIYTPSGKVRRKAKDYLNALESDSDAIEIKEIIDNFSHFELAGFEGRDYNQYRDTYAYSPAWRTVSKDGKSFVYTQVCVSEATGAGNWRNYKK